MKLKHNYHTHTVYCGHAKNTVEENVATAIAEGYHTLGFSEHIPWQVNLDRRMSMEALDSFVNDVAQAKLKYHGQLRIHCGLESEYNTEEHDWFFKLRHYPGIEYLILGNHFRGSTADAYYFLAPDSDSRQRDLQAYVEQVKQAIGSGLFLYLAHPDLIMVPWKERDSFWLSKMEELIIACRDANFPLGFNGNGFSMDGEQRTDYYPFREFWDLVRKHRAPIVLEVDAHDRRLLRQERIELIEKIIDEWGLADLVVTSPLL